MDISFPVHIVDDDPMVRESTKALLQGANFVVHCHPTAECFLERASKDRGCALIDLRMTGMDGIALQKELIERRSPLIVIVMTAYGDVPRAVEAMRLGAVDFLEKPFDPQHLLQRITTLAEAVDTPDHMQRNARQQAALIDSLTPRELQVLRGIVDGLANKQVASDLGISPRTVETHRVHIMQKLQADSLAHLVRIWLGAGHHSKSLTEDRHAQEAVGLKRS